MTSYEAVAFKDGKWWCIEIPALMGVTQARNVQEIEFTASDYIATYLDVPIDTVQVGVRLSLPSDITAHVEQVLETRAQAELAAQKFAMDARVVATELKDAGCTVREIGHLLHVSHQRAHQLLRRA